MFWLERHKYRKARDIQTKAEIIRRLRESGSCHLGELQAEYIQDVTLYSNLPPYNLTSNELNELVMIGSESALKALEQIAICCPNSGTTARALTAFVRAAQEQAMPTALKMIQDKDTLNRCAAVRALAEVKNRKAFEALVSSLDDSEKTVRNEAVAALENFGKEAILPIVKSLNNKVYPSDALLKTLDRLDHNWRQTDEVKDYVPALISDLNEYDAGYRVRCATTLALIGDNRAIDPLVKALKDQNADVRKEVKTALDKFGWEPKTIEEQISCFFAARDVEGFRALGDQAKEACLAAASSDNKVDSETALKVLCGFFDDPRVSDHIKGVLANNRTNVGLNVVQELCKFFRDPGVAAYLKELLADERYQKNVLYELGNCSTISVEERGEIGLKYLGDEKLQHTAAGLLFALPNNSDYLLHFIDYLNRGGNVYHRDIVTWVGYGLASARKSGRTNPLVAMLEKCITGLASKGDEEAASILWLIEHGKA
jgi:HEAT repeat protein